MRVREQPTSLKTGGQETSEPALLAEEDGHVLVVTINRPEKKNAVNAEVLCGLSDAWHRLDEDDDLRVAILTGAGIETSLDRAPAAGWRGAFSRPR
jgi:1,4-dihydroxy-2-naphthoyl-CoA synthase